GGREAGAGADEPPQVAEELHHAVGPADPDDALAVGQLVVEQPAGGGPEVGTLQRQPAGAFFHLLGQFVAEAAGGVPAGRPAAALRRSVGLVFLAAGAAWRGLGAFGAAGRLLGLVLHRFAVGHRGRGGGGLAARAAHGPVARLLGELQPEVAGRAVAFQVGHAGSLGAGLVRRVASAVSCSGGRRSAGAVAPP